MIEYWILAILWILVALKKRLEISLEAYRF